MLALRPFGSDREASPDRGLVTRDPFIRVGIGACRSAAAMKIVALLGLAVRVGEALHAVAHGGTEGVAGVLAIAVRGALDAVLVNANWAVRVVAVGVRNALDAPAAADIANAL